MRFCERDINQPIIRKRLSKKFCDQTLFYERPHRSGGEVEYQRGLLLSFWIASLTYEQYRVKNIALSLF
jgi:hypothetical protein